MVIAGLKEASVEIDFGEVIATDSIKSTQENFDYKV
jgi:hypothetical protein